MNPDSEMDDNISKRTKAVATAIPMAGIIVAATLLIGLSPFGGYYQQTAIAQQQNMTGTNTTSAGGTTTVGVSCTVFFCLYSNTNRRWWRRFTRR